MKPIRLSHHATLYFASRGFTETEVVYAIGSATWGPADRGRLECRIDLPFDGEWNGKHYMTKQIRPVFVDEPDEIVVVTVYTYYF